MNNNDKILSGELKLLQEYTVSDITMRPDGRPVEWTEERAVKLGKNMVEWMKNPENVFIEVYLISYGLYHGLTRDLCNKYQHFSHLYKQCMKIQEYRINSAHTMNNPMYAKFFMTNHHDYKDKVTTELDDNQSSNALKAWKKRQNTLNK